VASWPDACALLTERDLSLLATGYVPSPRPGTLPGGSQTGALAGIPLPKPVACDWIPPTDEGAVVSVSVEWVASSASAAQRLAAEENRYGFRLSSGPEITGPGGPDVVYHQLTTPAGPLYSALVRGGPVITKILASTIEAVRQLAPRLRGNLRATVG
jgi:hypothetical protein